MRMLTRDRPLQGGFLSIEQAKRPGVGAILLQLDLRGHCVVDARLNSDRHPRSAAECAWILQLEHIRDLRRIEPRQDGTWVRVCGVRDHSGLLLAMAEAAEVFLAKINPVRALSSKNLRDILVNGIAAN